MELLQHLLSADASAPRLSVYNEADGTRMDFSAQTLENWTSKIANMLLEELDLEPDSDSRILIDLPVSWQAAVIALGALAAGVPFDVTDGAAAMQPPADEIAVVFTSPEAFSEGSRISGADTVLVTQDPFGRGVVESGGELPVGTIDFGPTVRFYGDHFYGTTTPLPELFPADLGAERVLSPGWSDTASFQRSVLEPLAAGGSAVIVAGLCSADRLEEIADNEKVTVRA
ncbi:TIGR03089 family protein [Corynebacterium sp. FDAARGOS 1242]|uniref:TIGR03089 family protein n=1 Tax=Corynebacterium sp. FDAARGOS 1242 TaxID=2778078 RepID=UPI0019520B35|nr:TIGR03089 family protein [Corynebacterium sp. FDAARGOS 1242]QRP97125.1 TIGR03089 family protein [Corynebacterium sp. FDAARGOS 1242]